MTTRCIALLAPLALAGCVTLHFDHDDVVFDETFSAVVVDNETGDLTVTGGEDVPRMEVTARYYRSLPDLDWFVADDTLFVNGMCPRLFDGCSLDLVMHVPVDTDLDADITTGDVRLNALRGDLSVALTTGDTTLDDVRGTAAVATTTGNLVGTDLELTWLTADTTTGNIDVVHRWTPTLLDAESTTGNLDLLVPEGRYDVDADVTTGRVSVLGVINDPSADNRIRAHTTTGNVSVVGYTPPEGVYLPACTAEEGDPFQVLGAAVDGDDLVVSLGYSGGCAAHDFELCWPDGAFQESNPVQASLELLHDDHDDACDGVVTVDRAFDLLPLQQAWRDAYGDADGTIVLHVHGQTVSYVFGH